MKTENLTLYRIPVHTDAWFRFREEGLTEQDAKEFDCQSYPGGIGASECATILGLNKWRPVAAELYHFKCNTEKPTRESNRAMLMGKILEPTVKDLWTCFDGSEDGWVDNYIKFMEAAPKEKTKVQIRKARKINAYIVNSKYPQLFVSLDYFAEKGTPGIFDGQVFEEGFPVEIKTLNGMYAKMWESEIPIYHVVQINQQMLVTECEYAELPVLIDGRVFKCYPFKRDDDLCDRIIKYSEKFWKRVLEGRECKKMMDESRKAGDVEGYNEAKSYLDSMEPDPDNSEAYTEYIKNRHKTIINAIKGDIKLYKEAREYEVCLRLLEMVKDYQTLIKNKMLHILDQKNAGEISFDALGKITFSGKTLSFRLNTKPTKEVVEQEFNKLNFKL